MSACVFLCLIVCMRTYSLLKFLLVRKEVRHTEWLFYTLFRIILKWTAHCALILTMEGKKAYCRICVYYNVFFQSFGRFNLIRSLELHIVGSISINVHHGDSAWSKFFQKSQNELSIFFFLHWMLGSWTDVHFCDLSCFFLLPASGRERL